MIPLSKIKDRKVLITHKNAHEGCPDGIASAYICKQALPDLRVRFITYDKERDELQPEPGMLFVDMTPPEKTADLFVAAGAVCLDHHKTQRGIVEKFGELGVYADNETEEDRATSGALLAYRNVFLPLVGQGQVAMRALANLVGVADTWDRGSPDFLRARQLGGVLLFIPFDELLHISPWDIQEHPLVPILEARKRQEMDELWAIRTHVPMGSSYPLGVACTIPSLSHISDIAEEHRDEADVFVGYAATVGGPAANPHLVLSLRTGRPQENGKPIDVSILAKRLGGGGHAGAAGCRWDSTLYEALEEMSKP